jgi:hypothetical protein
MGHKPSLRTEKLVANTTQHIKSITLDLFKCIDDMVANEYDCEYGTLFPLIMFGLSWMCMRIVDATMRYKAFELAEEATPKPDTILTLRWVTESFEAASLLHAGFQTRPWDGRTTAQMARDIKAAWIALAQVNYRDAHRVVNVTRVATISAYYNSITNAVNAASHTERSLSNVEVAAGLQVQNKRVNRIFTVDNITTFAEQQLTYMVRCIPFTDRMALAPEMQELIPTAQLTRTRIP